MAGYRSWFRRRLPELLVLLCLLISNNLNCARAAFLGEWQTEGGWRSRQGHLSGKMEPIRATASQVTERVGLGDRFSRWRFLQNLLDDDLSDSTLIHEVLFHTLDIYLRFPRPAFKSTDETGSPERTKDRMELIEKAVDAGNESQSLSLRAEGGEYNQDLIGLLESLLPDPEEDEDNHKTVWDLVIELNGRESVKINEREGQPTWRINCLVARVLLFYDFLEYGLAGEPFQ